jgi:hypothetical protein
VGARGRAPRTASRCDPARRLRGQTTMDGAARPRGAARADRRARAHRAASAIF